MSQVPRRKEGPDLLSFRAAGPVVWLIAFVRSSDASSSAGSLHVLEQAELPQVTVRVVPFDVDHFAGISAPLVYARGPVPQLDTVLVDTKHGGAYVDAEAQLNRYRAMLHSVDDVALSAVKPKDLIRHFVQQM